MGHPHDRYRPSTPSSPETMKVAEDWYTYGFERGVNSERMKPLGPRCTCPGESDETPHDGKPCAVHMSDKVDYPETLRLLRKYQRDSKEPSGQTFTRIAQELERFQIAAASQPPQPPQPSREA